MTRILYVEDEADLRTTVVEVLEEEGFETASACNGAEGLAAADVFRPDIVITDWLMPVMTGIDMIRCLRAEGSRFAKTPVIMVSAHASQGEIDQALSMGACCYMTKPFDFDALLDRIEAFMSRKAEFRPEGCGCGTAEIASAEGD